MGLWIATNLGFNSQTWGVIIPSNLPSGYLLHSEMEAMAPQKNRWFSQRTKPPFISWIYPLVKCHITNWNITIFHGKTHYKWQFSIAMLNYQGVSYTNIHIKYWLYSRIMVIHDQHQMLCTDGISSAQRCGGTTPPWPWLLGFSPLGIGGLNIIKIYKNVI